MTPETQDAALPRTTILSYLTRTTTRTRVRVVASRVLWCVAAIACGLAASLGLPLGRELYFYARLPMLPGGPPGPGFVPLAPVTPSLTDYLAAFSMMSNRYPVELLIFLFLACGACTLPFLALLVAKGRRRPSLLAMCYMFIGGLLSLVVIIEISCNAFVLYFDPGRHAHNWWAILWLLFLPFGAILGALVNDVCAFLLWIARNPFAEKPPVPFLPGAGSVAGRSGGAP